MKKYILLISILLFSAFYSCASESAKEDKSLDYNTICFYYNWYGNVEADGELDHWAHHIAPTPGTNQAPEWISGENGDIAANYYPELKLYSSQDRKVVEKHMKMFAEARIGVLSLTWWGDSDRENPSVRVIMEEAEKYGIKVCFHIEPFGKRSAQTTLDNIRYIVDTYGNSDAFYRVDGRPMYFIYDSYLQPAEEWAKLLKEDGELSIRGTKYDGVFIGLWVKEGEEEYFLNSGFDGFYTYFASTGFTYGSTPENWEYLQHWAAENDKIFIPSVGPGYIDTRIRPWNSSTTREREKGAYYDRMYKAAIDCGAEYVSITSFNEWHEGTQIEPAISFKIDAFEYLDYQGLPSDFYLERTAYWVEKFRENR